MNVTVYSQALGRAEQRPFDLFGVLDEVEGVLTDEHASASYGLPVVLSKVSGRAYGPGDLPGAILHAVTGGITADEERRARAAGWRVEVGAHA